jgi:hypothetical protein
VRSNGDILSLKLCAALIILTVGVVLWIVFRTQSEPMSIRQVQKSSLKRNEPPSKTKKRAVAGYSQDLSSQRHVANSVSLNEAANRLRQLAPEQLDSEFAKQLMERWAAAEPCEAAVWAEGIQEPASRLVLSRIVAVAWAKKDPDALMEWLQRQPQGEEKNALCLAGGIALIDIDPLASMLLAEGLVPPFKSELRESGLVAWSKEDPIAAADFAAQFLGSQDGNRVLTRIARNWIIDSLPTDLKPSDDGPSLTHQATQVFGYYWARADPAMFAVARSRKMLGPDDN